LKAVSLVPAHSYLYKMQAAASTRWHNIFLWKTSPVPRGNAHTSMGTTESDSNDV